MKIDKTKLKKSLSEVPSDCKQLIEYLKSCNENQLIESLRNIKSWNYGKCELYHWIDVLDYFDSIMEKCVHKVKDNQWTLPCDLPENEKDKDLLINIILFTSLLIEHSFSKHVYSSMEHLTTLLASSDMQIVLAVLNLLYVFSKRSNFISRLSPDKKISLLSRLNHLADSWGGKENGFGLAECCQDLKRSSYPASATTLHFEFYNDETTTNANKKDLQQLNSTNTNLTSSPSLNSLSSNKLNNTKSSASIQSNTIHIENVDKITDQTLAELMEELILTYNVPKDKQMLLFTHLRLAHYFSNYRKRLQCVQARLQALSIIVYSNAMTMQENFNVLYNGFIEELVEVLELNDNKLLEIKAAAIRTLTSVIHLDHTTKLNSIIDITGAAFYHGFLPSLVRSCIQALIDNNTQQYTLQFATALFSFLYHLANYESGGEALVSCGMIDSLLKVISWKGTDSDHITFVTRAVRVIDLITNLEMAAFHTHADLHVFIDRLEYDVDMCRKDQPFEIEIKSKRRDSQDLELESAEQQTSMEVDNDDELIMKQSNNSLTVGNKEEQPLTLAEQQQQILMQIKQAQANQTRDLQCYPQRAAVLKSILNFLKKAIQDSAFSDSIRHLMDGSLPKSLKHIISNAEYYGPSLFMLATDVVTVYVFQEPSLLSSLQENGLTDVILHALLTKDIPATKEVLASLPNVFSALCLNIRGLELFKSFKPFDKIFRVLISPEYLPAMKRRRSTDPMGDTSFNLGNSMDELMRHLPSLKQSAIAAIINILKELYKLGSDPDTICSSKLPFKTTSLQSQDNQQPITRPSTVTVRPIGQNVTADNGNSSGDEEEEEEDTTPSNNTNVNVVVRNIDDNTIAVQATTDANNLNTIQLDNLNQNSNSNTGNPLNVNQNLTNSSSNTNLNLNNQNSNKQQVVPLVDYILHVMKFLDAILANNNTEDHCHEFVQQKGLEPLLMIHQLPNLPIDFPLSQACNTLGTACKSILTLSREKELLRQGLVCLQNVLDKLKPLHVPLEQPGGSVLLEEFVKASELCQSLNNNYDPLQSATLTPLLHNLSATHAYISMFICLTRTTNPDARNLCVLHWGSELGQSVLKELGQLYTSLVWESTILLAFCSENSTYSGSQNKFGQTQLERLAVLSKDNNQQQQQSTSNTIATTTGITTTTTNTTSSSSEDNTSGNNELRIINIDQTSTTNNPQQQQQQSSSSTANNQMDIDESTQFNVEETIDKTKTQVEVAQAILNNYRSKIKNKLSPETKQIKALLTSASRLGRALAELFNFLVKLSVNAPTLRHRRNNHHPIPSVVTMSPALTGVANSLTKLICNALSWVPAISPTPKFRLTFYICCVGFTSPLLFDERKHPYHLMLQSFVQCGGQDAFFETFRWALTQGGKVPIEEGLEHPNLSEGVGEFLDSWLMLLEKMVNPKMILESPHVLPNDSTNSKIPTFDPIKYLQQIHKKTFDCIMHLWNRKPLKVYGEHISETILLILCHLLRGETIIQNKINKDQSEQAKNLENRSSVGLGSIIANPNASDSATFSRNQQFPAARSSSSGLVRSGAIRLRDRASIEENEFNRNQIQQLVDMGFDRESAIDAFLHTSTLEQAAEYLIEHATQPAVGDFDMSEDDQVLRAIAMSLNDGNPTTNEESTNQQQSESASNAEIATSQQQQQQQETVESSSALNDNLLITDQQQQQQQDRQTVEVSSIATETNLNETKESSNSKHDEINEPSTSTKKEKESMDNDLPEEYYEPLSKELMDSLTNSLLSGCLKLLDTLPQTVHRVCDILLAVSQRNGEEWTKKMLQQLIDEIFSCVNKLLECSKPLTSSDRKSLQEWASQMSQIPEASKAASRIHLFSLLFEEKKNECAQYIEESNLITYLIMLLESAQDILVCLKSKQLNLNTTPNNKIVTPKWLAPVILLIDLYDKAAISSKRRAPLLAMPNRQWKYFDERNGRWTSYSTANNEIIDKAYCNGESVVRFYVNRKRYCVQFPVMVQVNEETVTYRPIMFVNAANSNESSQQSQQSNQDTSVGSPMDLADQINTNSSNTTVNKVNKFKVVKELNAQQNLSLIRACVSFLSIPVDIEALQAVMRLILRITRDYEMAKTFAELGGIKSILKTTQQSEFTEFISLATLIIRHVFEDPITLKQTMEKVLRTLCVSSLGNYREMHYQLRIFGPAACRNSEMFSELAKNLFRIQFNSVVTKKEDEDLRLLQPNAVQLLKILPSKTSQTAIQPTETIKEVISDLLNALTIKSAVTEDDLLHSIYAINQNLKTKIETMDTNEPVQSTQPQSAVRQPSASNLETEQMQIEQVEQQQQPPKSDKQKSVFEHHHHEQPNSVWRKEDYLFTQSVIMRILAELVKSYNVVSKLITDHQFSAGQSEYVTEDCSALAFILDNLLPNNQYIGDRDCPALSRLLIVALASSVHCQDAQVQLISEIKSALARALILSESSEKHLRIQALTGIINTMIDSYLNIQNSNTATQQNLHNLRNLASNLNSIIFRKGLFIDLARVSHSLDLSSPHMAVTINTVLKPLETLSRAIHHPSNQMILNQKKNKLPVTSGNNQQSQTTTNNQSQATDQQNRDEEQQRNQIVIEEDNTSTTNSNTQPQQTDTSNNSTTANVNSNQQTTQSSNNQNINIQQGSSSTVGGNQILGLNLLSSLLIDSVVNEETSSSQSNDRSALLRTQNSNLQVNDSVETVSVAEPMMDDTIVGVYDPSNEHTQQDHVININAIETETEEDNSSEEIDEDEDDEEDNNEDDVNDSAAEEDEEDDEEDHGDDDGESDGDDDEEISFATQGQELEDFVLRYAVPDELIWDLEENTSSRYQYRYFNEFAHLFEGGQHTNGADVSQPTVPPAPGTVSALHPLLSRNSGDNVFSINNPQNQYNSSILPRNFRNSRQRLSRISANQIPQVPSTITFGNFGALNPPAHSISINPQHNWQQPLSGLHPNNVQHSNTPVILQRLLGTQTQNFLQLTRSIPPARLVFTSNDYQVFANQSNWNDTQMGPESNDSSMLNSITTAITRWTEESKVLDGDSIQDCVACLKQDIISVWEKYRDEEMNERKEKRKELIEKERKRDLLRAELEKQEQEQEQQSTATTENVITSAFNLIEDSSSPASDQPSSITNTAANLIDNQSQEQLESQTASNETERMETQPSVLDSENISEDNQQTTQNEQDEEVIEMTCSETISTEQEMEITNPILTQNEGNSEETPEPNNTIEIALNQQNTTEQEGATASSQPIQESSSSTANNEEEALEGIDPTFLAALPDNIRQEVIAEQLRIQRLRQQRTTTTTAAAAATTSSSSSTNQQPTQQASGPSNSNELNPEFLAALPPVIQEELIAHHNTEQRNAALQSNPDSPVDPTDFIQTLPVGLRRQVLSDLDDSLLALLPSHLVNEAQMLRDEFEARQRHIHERLLTSHATNALSRILRNASVRGLASNQRYTIHTVPQGSFQFPFGSSGRGLNNLDSNNVYLSNMRSGNHNGCLINSKLRCKQLLDNEALSCLLILLFVDEPKLNIGRLHRVLKNLCNHLPTRQWIIQSLLSIMEKAKESKINQSISSSNITDASSFSQFSSGNSVSKSKKNSINNSNNQPSWLSISMDAALGCRTDVFQIQQRNSSKSNSYQISINPQAAHIVCRHVLDTLISLAKAFPHQFLPDTLKDPIETKSASQSSQTSGSQKDEFKGLNKDYDFWDVLAKLDKDSQTAASGRSNNFSKNKNQLKHNTYSSSNSSSLNQSSSSNVLSENQTNQSTTDDGHLSTLAQIINLLAHPVIKRNSLLTDKLLRLLSLLAKTLPPSTETASNNSNNLPTSSSNANDQQQQQSKSSVKPKEQDKPKSTNNVGEEQLKLAVEVLTSKSCSEEGLEDATSLLLKLSHNDPAVRDIVLKLLLQGARQLGQTVCQHINNLSSELKKLNINTDQPSTSSGSNEDDDKYNRNKRVKGVIQDRFTKSTILITGATNTKHNPSIREVQLPAMAALTCKTSSQSFFLRVLKVIIQLRESIKVFSNIVAAVNVSSRRPNESTGNDQMEIDKELATPSTNQQELEENTLSNQLQLNELWESLSDCLLELANTPDHRAVLVLQPAVEAFFFIHASEKDHNKRNTNENQLSDRDHLLGNADRADVDTELSSQQPLSQQSQHASNTTHLSKDPASLDDSMIASGTSVQASQNALSKDTQKFLKFAETHKVVLNQILRQSTTPLSEGPFSVLVDHTRVLDFDVKRRYFRTELDLLDEGAGRREDLAIHVRREHVFEDSFRELYRRSNEEWKNRFYIVFENEEGQDAGGLLREWYSIISREIFNPMYALFCTSPGDRVTYMINSSSHCNSNHLQYFKFVGHVIAKAIYDNKLLDCYFTRSFYKHILGKPVKYTDMESEDYTFYQSLVHFLEHDVDELGLDLTFSIEVQEFGVTEVRDLKENGRNIPVTEENKHEYVRLVCQEKMTYSIKKQLSAFLDGFYEIIPKRLISIFNEQELELLISGLPTIDIDDLKANTEYHKYQANSLQIQWFWRALRSFDQTDRAKFLQFVTGSSKVPLNGFATLEGMNGTQKFQIHKEDRSTERLPSAHTCFNQLDLPVYETYDKLRQMLLKAIRECSEGFGFA